MNSNRAISIHSSADLTKYRVNRPGQLEVLRQSFYDFQTYLQAGQTSMLFFQVPQGQSSKTKADTNMQLAGQLPAGQQFLVQSIEVKLYPSALPSTGPIADAVESLVNDMWNVGKSGWLEFNVGSKNYLTEAPLDRFPPKTRLDGWAALTSTLTAGAATQSKISYATFAGRPYPIDPYILLESTQNFAVQLNWPVAVAVAANARIGIILDGLLVRNSQ